MDPFGRMTLKEMREAVRRRANELRADVDTNTGDENSITQLGRLVTNPTIDMYLRSAIIKYFIDAVNADERFFSSEELIDIKEDVDTYELPDDMAFLRALYWKSEDKSKTLVPPNEFKLMAEIDTDEDVGGELTDDAPHYRMVLDGFILDQMPTKDNEGGVLVSYVKYPKILTQPGQYLERPIPLIFQELVVLDAAAEIVSQIMQLDFGQFKATLNEYLQRMIQALTMYKMPKSVRLRPTVTLVKTRADRNVGVNVR